MKKPLLLTALLLLAVLLTGCAGGQELEDCLFVLSLAVDPAPEGCLTVTIKAVSGTQDAAPQQTGAAGDEEDASEQDEPGYIVMSATAPSALRALSLLSGTLPRTVDLSQLREVVLSETIARTDATLSILTEIRSMFRANGAAIVVVTPDNAGDFIRRQRAILGVRLSQYLDVLFSHFAEADLIPKNAELSAVIAGMRSGRRDALAVYAAGNSFDAPLILPGESETDRLPGHLPRTAPAQNEYLGAAVFSGARMTGTLTGEEVGVLSLMAGRAQRKSAVIGGALYRVSLPTRVQRKVKDGAIVVKIRMTLALAAGNPALTPEEIAMQTERQAAAVLQKLQAAGSDAAGFGAIAARSFVDVPAWEAAGWRDAYPQMSVRVNVQVGIW